MGTQLRDALRRPASEWSVANKERALSYAAFRALSDVLAADTNSVYIPLMKQLGFDPNDNSIDIETPTGIGNVASAVVLEFRHHDNANQLSDLAQGPLIRIGPGTFSETNPAQCRFALRSSIPITGSRSLT